MGARIAARRWTIVGLAVWLVLAGVPPASAGERRLYVNGGAGSAGGPFAGARLRVLGGLSLTADWEEFRSKSGRTYVDAEDDPPSLHSRERWRLFRCLGLQLAFPVDARGDLYLGIGGGRNRQNVRNHRGEILVSGRGAVGYLAAGVRYEILPRVGVTWETRLGIAGIHGEIAGSPSLARVGVELALF